MMDRSCSEEAREVGSRLGAGVGRLCGDNHLVMMEEELDDDQLNFFSKRKEFVTDRHNDGFGGF